MSRFSKLDPWHPSLDEFYSWGGGHGVEPYRGGLPFGGSGGGCGEEGGEGGREPPKTPLICLDCEYPLNEKNEPHKTYIGCDHILCNGCYVWSYDFTEGDCVRCKRAAKDTRSSFPITCLQEATVTSPSFEMKPSVKLNRDALIKPLSQEMPSTSANDFQVRNDRVADAALPVAFRQESRDDSILSAILNNEIDVVRRQNERAADAEIIASFRQEDRTAAALAVATFRLNQRAVARRQNEKAFAEAAAFLQNEMATATSNAGFRQVERATTSALALPNKEGAATTTTAAGFRQIERAATFPLALPQNERAVTAMSLASFGPGGKPATSATDFGHRGGPVTSAAGFGQVGRPVTATATSIASFGHGGRPAASATGFEPGGRPSTSSTGFGQCGRPAAAGFEQGEMAATSVVAIRKNDRDKFFVSNQTRQQHPDRKKRTVMQFQSTSDVNEVPTVLIGTHGQIVRAVESNVHNTQPLPTRVRTPRRRSQNDDSFEQTPKLRIIHIPNPSNVTKDIVDKLFKP